MKNGYLVLKAEWEIKSKFLYCSNDSEIFELRINKSVSYVQKNQAQHLLETENLNTLF